MNGYTAAWLLWLASFFAIEGAALLTKSDGTQTLSEHVWSWASIKHKGNGWRVRRLVLVAFLAWQALHFLTGGKL